VKSPNGPIVIEKPQTNLGKIIMASRKKLSALKVLAASTMLAFGGPAFADVKAGVDAWSAGDYAAAVREWSGPAAEGDPDAQFNMAQAFRLGRGVETDASRAEALYKSAAAQGHTKAADNYGLLLFQDGRRQEAMPYVNAAAGRGDPRAQYLLGIAHFNGDLVKKDWVRAYALMSLANATGLPQASTAIAEMDKYVPLEQRQKSQVLAQNLKAEAEATRARSLAAADLEFGAAQQSGAPTPRAAQPTPRPATPVTASAAGADFARPTAPARPSAPVQTRSATPEPVRVATAPARPAAAPRSVAPAALNGPWKVQLGAFGVASNADRMWSQLGSHAALSGSKKITLKSGRLTRLQAGGFTSRSSANAACSSLKRSGHSCLVTK
jgi:cell division protein FtsN